MTRRLLQSAGLDQLRDLARSASVTQLRRVLSSYSFDTPPSPEGERPEEHHRVSFGYTEEGSWSLSALLPSDEGRCGSGRLLWPENELFRAAQGDQARRSVFVGRRAGVGGRPVAGRRCFEPSPPGAGVPDGFGADPNTGGGPGSGCRVPRCERSH